MPSLTDSYWLKKSEYEAVKQVFDQVSALASQARQRRQTALSMLEAAKHQLDYRKYSDYQRDVVVFGVALAAAAVAAWACPPLAVVMVRRTGFTMAGRMGKKISLRIAIGAFALSSASQFAVSKVVTGKGSAVAGVILERVFSTSIEDLINGLPEAVALLACVRQEQMYEVIVAIERKAQEEAAKISSTEEEKTVLTRTILLNFWTELSEQSMKAWADLIPYYERVKAEYEALERQVSRLGPIAPPSAEILAKQR